MEERRPQEQRWYEGASPWLVALFVLSIALAVAAAALLLLSPLGWD